ncbi:HD-GYP domain-containing protein [Deinococcus navajonensis]|uniref:HD-GYP domain-containing protein n=1 Tax=Deinococcus navajonensis TaxID=309884 RepID=A0ABV8XLJ0_9DEIO
MSVPSSVSDNLPALTLHLAQQGLAAPDLGSAMTPVLDALVGYTSAAGAAYFQLRAPEQAYFPRAACGDLGPRGLMSALQRTGVPTTLPIVQALHGQRDVLFFDDTRQVAETAVFAELSIQGLCAAPVHDRQGQLVGALLAHTFEPCVWTVAERTLIRSVTSLLALLAARLDAEERERDAHESALRALGLCLEARDAEIQGHTDRVTALAVQVARRLGLDETELRALRWGAYLHDIGKIGIPDAVLRHPGQLSTDMWALMRGHVQGGLQLATQLPFLPQTTLDIIALHHERWDGGGYPHGKRGEDIPLSARIFAVCDVYDALVNVRPYKRAWTHQEAMAHIQAHRGTHFDPQVVDILGDVLASVEMADDLERVVVA